MCVVWTCQEIKFTSINFFASFLAFCILTHVISYVVCMFLSYLSMKHLWGVHKTGKKFEYFFIFSLLLVNGVWLKQQKYLHNFCPSHIFLLLFYSENFIKTREECLNLYILCHTRPTRHMNVNKSLCTCEECWVIIMTMTRLDDNVNNNNYKYMSCGWYLNAGGVICMEKLREKKK